MSGVLSGVRGKLSPQHWFLLSVLAATSFFDGYDGGIIAIALPQIRDTFDLTKSQASGLLAIVYLGALPAIFITRWSDRLGRRRLLLYSIFGYTIATGMTAVAPNPAAFAACQFVSHLFLNAEAAIVWTMAAEELPADTRGFGFGWLAMHSALGFGFGSILFGGFLEPNGVSWRWMYVVGLPFLMVIAVLRRKLPESGRFLAARDGGRLMDRWHTILRPPHRRWLVLVVSTTFLAELTAQAALFTIDFLQTDRGMSATAANFMLVAAGLPGIPIMVVAGSLSDRFGRRLVGCGFATLSIIGAMGFFWLPGGIPVLLPFMSCSIVGQLGAWPTLGAFTSELFPTGLRGQAGSWATVFRVAGQSSSFALASVLLAVTTQSVTVTALVLGPAAAVAIYAIAFPDTHGRELEDISGEDAVVLRAQPSAVGAVTAL